jgi:thioredoxin 1
MVKEINAEKFDEILGGKKPVVCDFFATWCGPCKMLSPVLDEVSQEFADKVKFIKVDIDKNFELAAKYEVMTVPCVMFFKDGEPINKMIGYSTKEETQKFIEKSLNK